MAELVIKPRSVGSHEKDDILCAFNDRMIRQKHSEHICFERDPVARRFSRLNGAGLLDPDDVARDWCRSVFEFEFERLGVRVATVTRLSDGNTIEFESGIPFIQHDGKLVEMDIVGHLLHITKTLRAKDARGKPIFGLQNGREIWYGGIKDLSNATLDKVWNAIETKTPLREIGFPFWPAGTSDLKMNFFAPVDDFDDTEADLLVEQEVDNTDPENLVVIRNRKRQVHWESLAAACSVPVAHVLDRDRIVDVRLQRRSNPFNRASIVRVKQ